MQKDMVNLHMRNLFPKELKEDWGEGFGLEGRIDLINQKWGLPSSTLPPKFRIS